MRATSLILASLVLLPTAAAAETITYSYDSLGRLIGTEHAGSVNNGLVVRYEYDAADNLKSLMVARPTFSGSTRRLIVLPVAGLPVLVLPPSP